MKNTFFYGILFIASLFLIGIIDEYKYINQLEFKIKKIQDSIIKLNEPEPEIGVFYHIQDSDTLTSSIRRLK